MAFLDVAIADALFGEDNELSEFKRGTSLAQSLLGRDQEEAIREAQAAQDRLGREALATQIAAQARLEETLAPFVGFGTELIGQVDPLFGATAAESIAGSPTLTAFNELGMQAVSENPFLSSLSPEAIEQQQLINNIDLLSRERGDLLSAIGLGQASAAQQAAGQIETGARRADLLSQLGNVAAAGNIAQANIGAQRTGNLAGLGAGLLSAFNFGGGGQASGNA
jgi:hypothetical protein